MLQQHIHYDTPNVKQQRVLQQTSYAVTETLQLNQVSVNVLR